MSIQELRKRTHQHTIFATIHETLVEHQKSIFETFSGNEKTGEWLNTPAFAVNSAFGSFR